MFNHFPVIYFSTLLLLINIDLNQRAQRALKTEVWHFSELTQKLQVLWLEYQYVILGQTVSNQFQDTSGSICQEHECKLQLAEAQG